jgi:Na+-driven multidrug efflux pump
MWILYYELDTIFIGKYIGIKSVALYAISFTLINFFRSILGVFFAPFGIRFNHLIGQVDNLKLKEYFNSIIYLSAPIVIIPILTFYFFRTSFILSWVGETYSESIEIAGVLLLCNVFAFISYPSAMLISAKEDLKVLYLVNTILPIIFWVGVFTTYSYAGILSFAIFKLVAFIVLVCFYLYYIHKKIQLRLSDILFNLFKQNFFPVLFIVGVSFMVNPFLPIVKSRGNLFIVISVIGFVSMFAFLIYVYFSDLYRSYLLKLKDVVSGIRK